jgi:hypothetical protein
MRSWNDQPNSLPKQRSAATAAATRLAKHHLGDVVASSDASGKARQEIPRDSTQKATYERLMEAVVTKENATAAWRAVKRTEGAPGIDRMMTGQLGEHIGKHWETFHAKLLAGTYVPSLVKRVEIPKPMAEPGCWASRRWWIGGYSRCFYKHCNPSLTPPSGAKLPESKP